MNTSSTLGTAWLRSVWIFIAAFASAAIPSYMQLRFGADWSIGRAAEYSVLTGIMGGTGAAIARGGLEGLVDRGRQIAGNVKPSDVQPGNSGKP